MEEATWDTLPPHLFELILERLPILDYLRSSAVCSSWRLVQHSHRRRHASSPRYEREKPWLMFLLHPADHIILYNLSEQRYYRFPYNNRWFGGCSNGWLFIMNYSTKELFFGNPFTGSEITVPSINQWIKSYKYFHFYAIISSNPTDPDCIFILWKLIGEVYCLINGESRRIRSVAGPEFWPTFTISGCEFYILDKRSDSSKNNLISIKVFPILSQRYIEMDWYLPEKPIGIKYLVESNGELLMAILENNDEILHLDVFKADLAHNVWVKMESLDDRVLFLCTEQSFSLSAVDTRGPGNHIYFTSAELNGPINVGDHSQDIIWFEYDYKTHLMIESKLSSLKPDEFGGWLRRSPSWIAPNLAGI